LYSTPSCYLKALHDLNVAWPSKTDDFFPYASDPNGFWTGYFTSRPTSKRFERVGNQFLQICKKLSATAKVKEEKFEETLTRLKTQMGVMQHHDAVTGTEKQHVADDYHRELHASIVDCEENTRSSLNQLMTGKEPNATDKWNFKFESCLNLNISVCEISENSQKFMVTVYNPLGHSTNQFVRFPVGGDRYEVRDHENKIIASQIVSIPSTLADLHYRTSQTSNELVFKANEVPAVGYKSFYISRLSNSQKTQTKTKILEEVVSIGSEDFKITFNEKGIFSHITIDGETNEISQNFFYYKSVIGDNREFANRSSGAYIFRPFQQADFIVTEEASIEIVTGDQVDEVHQTFSNWISQVVRIYKTEKFVEFEWLVGPIPVEGEVGKEIVSRFTTNMKTDGVVYTDSNGREMLKRKRNFRETWDLVLFEPVAGNFYLINSKIAIEDENHRLAILVDRAEGGASMIDGTVELMVRTL
jgi:lysosomal alpha-mannosidase